jgi:hypothetical protein
VTSVLAWGMKRPVSAYGFVDFIVGDERSPYIRRGPALQRFGAEDLDELVEHEEAYRFTEPLKIGDEVALFVDTARAKSWTIQLMRGACDAAPRVRVEWFTEPPTTLKIWRVPRAAVLDIARALQTRASLCVQFRRRVGSVDGVGEVIDSQDLAAMALSVAQNAEQGKFAILLQARVLIEKGHPYPEVVKWVEVAATAWPEIDPCELRVPGPPVKVTKGVPQRDLFYNAAEDLAGPRNIYIHSCQNYKPVQTIELGRRTVAKSKLMTFNVAEPEFVI